MCFHSRRRHAVSANGSPFRPAAACCRHHHACCSHAASCQCRLPMPGAFLPLPPPLSAEQMSLNCPPPPLKITTPMCQPGEECVKSTGRRFSHSLPSPPSRPPRHMHWHRLTIPHPSTPLPHCKKRPTFPLSPEMTPPAGLWNILILFPNSYCVRSV